VVIAGEPPHGIDSRRHWQDVLGRSTVPEIFLRQQASGDDAAGAVAAPAATVPRKVL